MNRDDVIRMAREAGLPSSELYHGNLERFAALVAAYVRETEFKPDWMNYQQGLADGAAAERERLHDKFMEIHKSQQHSNNYWHFAARKIKEQE